MIGEMIWNVEEGPVDKIACVRERKPSAGSFRRNALSNLPFESCVNTGAHLGVKRKVGFVKMNPMMVAPRKLRPFVLIVSGRLGFFIV
ncbi:hypothetical protein [Sporosarcina ureae]|nr:hypothetical protein [Sporosarcina ureae]